MKWDRKILSWLCALLAVVAIQGCKKPVPADVLARVGDREIRIDEFSRLAELRQRGNPVPLDPEEMLEELVVRETYVQAARKAGIESDQEVQEQIRDLLVARLKQRELTPRLDAITVSADEIQSSYEKRAAEFATPERVHLAMLFLQAPAGDAPAVRQRIEYARSQVEELSRQGVRSFGALAVEYSDHQSTRYKGGDLGWVERSRHPQWIEPQVIEAGFALQEPSATSEVIRGENGFYLIRLVDREAPSVAPLERVAPAIEAALLRAKREQIESEFVAQIRDAVPVEMHLERLPASVTTSAPGASLPPKLP